MPNSIWLRMLQPEIMVFMVPIVAIIAAASIKIVRMLIAHHERITMIQHGIHPDYPPEDVEANQNPPDKGGAS
jgi:hypothetical protein